MELTGRFYLRLGKVVSPRRPGLLSAFSTFEVDTVAVDDVILTGNRVIVLRLHCDDFPAGQLVRYRPGRWYLWRTAGFYSDDRLVILGEVLRSHLLLDEEVR